MPSTTLISTSSYGRTQNFVKEKDEVRNLTLKVGKDNFIL